MKTIPSLAGALALAAGLVLAAPAPAQACPGAKSARCGGKVKQCGGKSKQCGKSKSCGDKKNKKNPSRAEKKSKAATVVVAIRGMTCQGCASRVQKALGKLSGILSAQVEHAKGRAIVKYNAAALKPAVIVKTISKLGYKASVAGAKARPVSG